MQREGWGRLVGLVLTILALIACLGPGTVEAGRYIQVAVVDAVTGEMIEGATVELRAGDLKYQKTTDASGRLTFGVGERSVYTLLVGKAGYEIARLDFAADASQFSFYMGAAEVPPYPPTVEPTGTPSCGSLQQFTLDERRTIAATAWQYIGRGLEPAPAPDDDPTLIHGLYDLELGAPQTVVFSVTGADGAAIVCRGFAQAIIAMRQAGNDLCLDYGVVTWGARGIEP
jgi:hypothetical protein